MNVDIYGEIINGNTTYKKIANELVNKNSVIIGWTDKEYDHRDILFTFRPKKYGSLQRGLNFNSHLYVSIISCNSMGFLVDDKVDNRKTKEYIMEKLNLYNNDCNKAICELINGVIYYLDFFLGNRESE